MNLPLALTIGEPAGIGPDCVIEAAQLPWPVPLIVYGDRDHLLGRAKQIHRAIKLEAVDFEHLPEKHIPGQLYYHHIPLNAPSVAGKLNTKNSQFVLDCLTAAYQACANKQCHALVTGPVNKAAINDEGFAFTGQTEFLAQLGKIKKPVMMLASETLRVALVTTHLPIKEVANAITPNAVKETLEIVYHALKAQWGIQSPRITVCGLNPHAGEGGHLGREEIEIITPVIEQFRQRGWKLQGPLPADTVFTPMILKETDAVIAMYHDQGLAPLKALSFGSAVNITLGLPVIRTSVDHGTALSLAGSGQAKPDSFIQAMQLAIKLAPYHTLS